MRFAKIPSLAVLFTGLGCGLVTAPITESLPEITVPAAAAPGEALAPLQAFSIPQQSTGPADFAAVDSLTFAGTGPAGNFDFLSEIHVVASSPGLADIEIANLVPTPTGVASLSLNVVPNVNLMPYFQAGCSIQINVVGSSPSQPFSFDGTLVASVGL